MIDFKGHRIEKAIIHDPRPLVSGLPAELSDVKRCEKFASFTIKERLSSPVVNRYLIVLK